MLAAALAALLMVGLAVTRVSQAGFSAATDNAAGWAAGSVHLYDDDAGSVMFNTGANGLLDGGQSLTRCITVTYDGSLTAGVIVKMTGTATGALSPYLSLAITSGTGGSNASCAGFAYDSDVYTGTLASFAGSANSYATGAGTWRPAVVGESRTYKIVVTVQNVAAAQNASAGGTFTWEARSGNPKVVTYAEAVGADHPITWWRLDETSGTTAADASGNAQPGTYVGSPALGVAPLITVGKAVTLAAGKRVTGASTAVTASPVFTAEAWVRTTASGSTQYIATRGSNGGNGRWGLYVNPDGTVTGKNFTTNQAVGTSTVVNDGVRHHVVMSQTLSDLSVYIDGSRWANQVGTGAATDPQPLFVGSDWWTDNPFLGTIDEFAIYNTGLNAGRVAAHYQAGLAVEGPTLVDDTTSTSVGFGGNPSFPMAVTPGAGDFMLVATSQWESTGDPVVSVSGMGATWRKIGGGGGQGLWIGATPNTGGSVALNTGGNNFRGQVRVMTFRGFSSNPTVAANQRVNISGTSVLGPSQSAPAGSMTFTQFYNGNQSGWINTGATPTTGWLLGTVSDSYGRHGTAWRFDSAPTTVQTGMSDSATRSFYIMQTVLTP